MTNSIILGISSYYHDSAACLLVDGQLIAAAQEERFSRKKHDDRFPMSAIEYVLSEAELNIEDVNIIAFYDKPFLKFERLLETYHVFVPNGLKSFIRAMPVWMKEKLFLKKEIKKQCETLGRLNAQIVFPEHHLSHAASAFYPSPFDNAAILTIDGVGEWATTTIAKGSGSTIEMLNEIHFPHSIGLLYSAFTYYCGFRVNSGEYKLMGLAPYGNPNSNQTKKFKELIYDHLIDVRPDGSFILNMDYFNYSVGLTMTHDKKWETLFDLKRREPETELNQNYMNLALAIQQATEEIILKLVQCAKDITNSKNLVLAGGVALNCVANGKILQSEIFENIWIQPAAGDAGGCVGAALASYFINDTNNNIRKPTPTDSMSGSYLGPKCSTNSINNMIRKYKAISNYYETWNEMYTVVAKAIDQGMVVGWCQGRMEFGPRALGSRSILADPRNPAMQKKLNLKIKYREGFRPFAPSVLEEDCPNYFKLNYSSPYMLIVAPVVESIRKDEPPDYHKLPLYDKLYHERSGLPAITHIDYSARVQTVSKNTNSKYWNLIHEFKKQTGCGALINTSFNVRGEPIVCTAEDAYLCFMNTEMDILVIENFVFIKSEQPTPTDIIKSKVVVNQD